MNDSSSPLASPIAIVGVGCLFPGAQRADAFWSSVKRGVDQIRPIPDSHWRVDDYFDPDPKSPDRTYAKRGGFLDPVPFAAIEYGITPSAIEATDTTQLLGLVAARQALVDAGYGPEKAFDRDRVSVILGVTGTLELVIPLGARLGHPHWRRALKGAGVDDATADDVVARISDAYVPWQENSFPGLLGNVVAGRIANRLDLGGTNCVVDAACASSLSALHLAMLELSAGRCDAVVTGGADTFNDIFMYMCFSKTPALSPTGDSRPFAQGGDGTILGEGIGMLVLKRLADAERDGDAVYAVIKGVGSSSDGKGNAIYAPSAKGQAKALRAAYDIAGVTPDTITLVEGHGTGTRVGDNVEATALAEVYGAARNGHGSRPWCALGSVKSQIGHTKAAAGAAGLIKAALALRHKVLPPTLKVDRPVEALAGTDSPFYVNTDKRPWLPTAGHPRRAAVSSFGFGGSNFHVVLEEHAATKAAPDWDDRVQVVALSAQTDAELKQAVAAFPDAGDWPSVSKAAAESRGTFRRTAPLRLTAVVSQGEAGDWKKSALELLGATPVPFVASRDGVCLGRGDTAGGLAFLFPGQGSQALGMQRDLACLFPEVLGALAEADAAIGPLADGGRLSDAVFPPTAFADDAKKSQEARLRDTAIAQPAIGAASLGALRLLRAFGVDADAYAGHSFGELVALHAAGCFDAAGLLTLARERGRLMAAQAAKGTDAGTMLAVLAPLSDVEAALKAERIDLVLANKNAPSQVVLSGATAEIDKAERLFAARKVRAVRLGVSGAFHSPLVAAASVPFRAAVAGVTVSPPAKPVIANGTGLPYPTDVGGVRETLGGQLARPVEWLASVRRMLDAGVRTFVEVGPGSTLTKLVKAIAEDAGTPVEAFATDASAGKGDGVADFARALARLAALGRPVELPRWNPAGPHLADAGVPAKKGTVLLTGANYVSPRPERPARVIPPSPPAPVAAAPVPQPVVVTTPKPQPPQPRTPMSPDPNALGQALQVTQQSLAAFQKLQEQTAALHRQFLDHQAAAQETLSVLVAQQHALIAGGPVAPLPARATVAALPPVAAPAPVFAPPVYVPPPAPPMPVATAATVSNGVARHAAPAPAPAKSPPPAPPLVAAAAKPVSGDAAAVLMAVVAEKTGYPAEMLEPGMSLDADLGIDSIKRVEILSALQERLPDAPTVKPEHLGTLHTLADIVAFLGATPTAPAPEPAAAPSPAVSPALATDAAAALMAVVAEKTGYPAEMLEPGMSLDADLGIDSIKRVEILSALQERLPDAPTVKPEHLGTLHTLADIVAFLNAGGTARATTVAAAPAPTGSAPAHPLQRLVPTAVPGLPRERAAITPVAGGTAWVVGTGPLADALRGRFASIGLKAVAHGWADVPPDAARLGALILVAPAGEAGDFGRLGFRWLQAAAPGLRSQAALGHGTPILASVSSQDGAFGLVSASPSDPSVGALAGLVKTAGREWANVACKAFDVALGAPDTTADAVAAELLTHGPPEVGVGPDGSLSHVDLVAQPTPPGGGGVLGTSDVVLVTGGARGVTFEAALALAGRYRPAVVLMGRTPLEAADAELDAAPGEAEIKALLLSRNRKQSPRELSDAAARALAGREVWRNLERLRQTGVAAEYVAADVADAGAVRAAIADVESRVGPVTALVHGAGVLADRRIEDLTAEQFERVYRTKVDGLRACLDALGDRPLKALVAFSSTTARLGRVGQLSYAMANETLNKTLGQYARRHPDCAVRAMNWGPWEGGMVTPGLRKVFEAEGVGLIPLRAGAELLAGELSAAGGPVEVVVVGAGSIDAAPPPLEVPTPAPAAVAPPPLPAATVPVTPEPPAADLLPAFERDIEIDAMPVLRSHVLDGKAVLPLALHLEWLAHAAIHRNPGLLFHGLDGLQLLSGVKVSDGQALPVRVLAGKAVKEGGLYRVPVEMRSRRADGREALHSRARVVLASMLPEAPRPMDPPRVQPHPQTLDECYRYTLFHGPLLQGIQALHGFAEDAVVASSAAAPPPGAWLSRPLRSNWLADPLAVDVAFQLLIVWSRQRHGAGSLPTGVASYRQYRRAFPNDRVRVVVRLESDTGSLARSAIDFLDAGGALVARMEGAECVIDASLNEAFGRNRLPSAVSNEG